MSVTVPLVYRRIMDKFFKPDSPVKTNNFRNDLIYFRISKKDAVKILNELNKWNALTVKKEGRYNGKKFYRVK